MKPRVLVVPAGSGSSNNLIRGLRAGGDDVHVVGCHHERLILATSTADRKYLIPPLSVRSVGAALRRVIDRERIDLIVPTTDAWVAKVGALRRRLGCTVFLPTSGVIALCQDKYALSQFLAARGVPVPLTFPIDRLADVDAAFARFPSGPRLWCRVRAGAGSVGATPVKDPDQARSWIRYWEEMRGVPAGSFTLSEYLPGRDFACQMLWERGEAVLVKTTERLSYVGGASSPSGVSSTGAIHKTVREPEVVAVCIAAVRALDPRARGAFSVDLKADRTGRPCLTEINVGRFLTGTPIFDGTGKHNMTATYVRLALGRPIDVAEPYDVDPDRYMVRDLDALPAILAADDFFADIHDA